MIHIDFDPDKLDPLLKGEWDQLQADIQTATADLIAKWESTHKLSQEDLDDGIWRRMNDWLKDHVFHGKCAYCETNLEAARQTGDAEHYRPKLKVNFKAADNKSYVTPKVQNELGQDINHPGYFWLAYHWKNLLPACKFCNAIDGKKNQFPTRQAQLLVRQLDAMQHQNLRQPPYASTKPDRYYLEPDDLDALEEPLLLHPYRDQPDQHLVFDEFGNVTASSDGKAPSAMGENSINVYDLKGAGLVTGRQTAQQSAKMLFDMAFGFFHNLRGLSLLEARQNARQESKIAQILEGKSAYSAAQVAYLKLTHSL
ncbi:MAG: hypothetical protein U1G07_06285 [Verrucomicrobiota bacterium]